MTAPRSPNVSAHALANSVLPAIPVTLLRVAPPLFVGGAGLSRADTILHEMAHMWFGDLVTMKVRYLVLTAWACGVFVCVLCGPPVCVCYSGGMACG